MEAEIKKGAIFIADSHTQNGRESLIFALEKLLDSPPSQIFFMGDISNILVGNLKSSVESNCDLIRAISAISAKCEVFYFEGNHDFNLARILPNVKVISRKNQPLLARFGDKTALLAHGDIFCGIKYEIYIRFLTSKIMARILNVLDFISCGRIYRITEKIVQSKKLRFLEDESTIRAILKKRVQAYQKYLDSHKLRVNLIIEGHFHLGKIEHGNFTYIALPAFYSDGFAFKECDLSMI